MGKWHAQPICKECGGAAVAKGLCDMHYKRQWRGTEPCKEGRKRHRWTIRGTCLECGKQRKNAAGR